MNPKVGNVVKVHWIDAQDHTDTWVYRKDCEDFNEVDCNIISVGFLIKQTARYLTLGSDWDVGEQSFGAVRKIPTGMVQKIEDLTVPQET